MGLLKQRAMGFHTGHSRNDLKIRFEADPVVERANEGFALQSSPLFPVIERGTRFSKEEAAEIEAATTPRPRRLGRNRIYLARRTSMNVKTLVLATSLLLLPLKGAFAQQTTPQQRHTINQRSANQQARINKGVADGQITPGGAAKADANQARINSRDARMRSRDNGHLTSADRHKLARQQNRTSRGIYDRNHNSTTDPGVAPK